MSEVGIEIALLDFVPVFLFLGTGIFLCKVFEGKRWIAVPVIGVFVAGFSKALCKLLGVYDVSFDVLDAMKFAHMYLQSAFFICISVIVMAQMSKKIETRLTGVCEKNVYIGLAVVFVIDLLMMLVPMGKMVSMTILLIATLMLWYCLFKISVVNSIEHNASVVVVSALFSFSMIFMALFADHSATTQLIEECINSMSQLFLLIATYRIMASSVRY